MSSAKKEHRKPSNTQREITHFVVFGDSLSDAKNMGEKFSFLGSWAKGLWLKLLGLDKSPKERFTNGYTWADVLRASLISKFINDDQIKKDSEHRFGKYNLDNADISDDVLYHSHTHRKYTKKEVIAESIKVREKKREQEKDTEHLFGSLENTPEDSINPSHIIDRTDIADVAVAQRYKKNTQHVVHKKMGLLKARQESSDDLSDKLITDIRYKKYVEDYYSLDNGRTGQYNGHNFFADYAQGGATSYDYSWKSLFLSLLSPLTSIKLFFTRLLVSNLSTQVDQFLGDIEKQEDYGDKEKTLITIFSGANDLITVNSEPTEDAAHLAVKSNLENIEKLIKKGYTNFALCNLPDLSLCPRFQNKTPEERDHAQKISNYFNQQLKEGYNQLQKKYPKCSIDLFDSNTVFGKIYSDVKEKGEKSKYAKYFDPKKLKEPYIDSPDYKITPEGTSPGAKHMFWDDVHPTATMHALLMSEFYKSKELGKYKLSPPSEDSAEQLCKKFERKYHEKLKDSWFNFFSSNKELPIDYKDPEKALITILRYALDKHNKYNKQADFIREAMVDLGWWVNDKPNMRIPVLADAMWILDPNLAQELEKTLDTHLEQPQPASHSKMGMMMGTSNTETPHKRPVPPELALPPEVERKLNMKKNTQASSSNDNDLERTPEVRKNLLQ